MRLAPVRSAVMRLAASAAAWTDSAAFWITQVTIKNSRTARMTDEHRLVYKIADDEARIAACRYQYEH